MIQYTQTSTANWPVHIRVGGSGTGVAPSIDITPRVDLSTLRIEETGNQEPATLQFDFLQRAVSVPSNAVANQFADFIVPEGHIEVRHGGLVFRGHIKQMAPSAIAIHRRIHVVCHSYTALMDKCVLLNKAVRKAGESDRSRIQFFINDGGICPQYSTDVSNWDMRFVQELNASMPRQTFANLSMRQVIERILGTASPTANYYFDSAGRLHTWDRTHLEENNSNLPAYDQAKFTAPYELNVTHGPRSGVEIAPEDLMIEWDTSNLVNYYVVRGKGIKQVVGNDASFQLYGRRDSYIDAPDADTLAKVYAVGNAALSDTKDPTVRGSFSVSGDSCVNGSSRWMPGQTVIVTSPQHGIFRQGYRVVRVTTTYLSGGGMRRQEIEFGGMRRRLRNFGAS